MGAASVDMQLDNTWGHHQLTSPSMFTKKKHE